MGTPTATVRASKPAVGGDTGPVFANEINLGFDLFDRAINGRISVAIPDTNVTLLADGSASDQAVYQFLTFTGALTATRNVTIPACQKIGLLQNATTGGFSLNVTTGSGVSFTLPADSSVYRYICDGTNVSGSGLSSFVGTFQSASGSSIALPHNTDVVVCSLTLVPGDWDVSGIVQFNLPANDALDIQCGFSSVNRTVLNFGAPFSNGALASGTTLPTWTQQITLSVTTTVNLFAFAFSNSSDPSMTASGTIRARRWR